MRNLVILFSGRKSNAEQEIIEILTLYGANYISDKAVILDGNGFTVISEYKKSDVRIKNGVALFIDDTDRFDGQIFSDGIIGICEDTNIKALNIFEKSGIPVISCGMNGKNTVTVSSIDNNSALVTVQRNITDCFGGTVYTGEFIIKLSKKYSHFGVMASTAVLLLHGITPDKY